MYTVTVGQDALDDLRTLDKHEQKQIVDAIAEQLAFEPLTETRNRKPLRPNDLSTWELRVDRFRIFYDVHDASNEVLIKAIGWKVHNKLFIRGREFKL